MSQRWSWLRGSIFLLALFLALGAPGVSAEGEPEEIPEPGPDWWYVIQYEPSDGSIDAIVAAPPGQGPPDLIIQEGQALLDISGQPVAWEIYNDARQGNLRLWYVDLTAGIPVRREPVSARPSLVPPSSPLLPLGIAVLLSVGSGVGVGLIARTRGRRKMRNREA